MAASQNDFFGVGNLSADPMAARSSQMATMLSQLQSAQSAYQKTLASQQQTSTPTSTAAYQEKAQIYNPYQSAPANYAQTQGGTRSIASDTSGGSASGQAQQNPGDGPGDTPVNNPANNPIPPGYTGPFYSAPGGGSTITPPTGTSGSTDGEYSRIPTDLGPLRGFLQDQLLNMLQNPKFSPEIRFEDLQVPMDPSWGQYNNILTGGLNNAQGMMQNSGNTLANMANQGAYQMNFDPVQPAFARVLGGGTGLNDQYARWATQESMLGGMAANGAPQGLDAALDAIQQRSRLMMDDLGAQQREQYASRGLGAGTDVNQAIATGQSRGIADMQAQMAALASDNYNQAAGRQLSAGTTLSQNALGLAGLGVQGELGYQSNLNTLMGNYAGAQYNQGQLNEQNFANRVGAAQGSGAIGGDYLRGLAALAPSLGMYPQMAQANSEANMTRGIDEIIRRSQGPPILPMAMNYASAVPAPAAYQPNNSGAIWGALGQIGGGLASTLPFWSSRDMKEDIEPVKDSAIAKLRKLPISTWRYKGDTMKHIGPMAQDFQKHFGVGDGQQIHLTDMLGVLLAVQKEQVNASAKR